MVQKIFLTRVVITLVVFIMSFSIQARAEIIFEAYYKIFLSDLPVGYSVERYEFDKKKSEFVATTYTKIKMADKDTSESIKARANAKLTPLSYEYTYASVDPKTQEKSYKNIKATIMKDVLKAKVLEGKREYDITKSLAKGTYLSVFLPFAILNSKDGLKVDKHYSYQAISEETAEPHPGEAYVKSKEDFDGISAFKILNKYDKDQFISIMTASGDMLEVRMPTSQLKLKMVATQAEAVDQFQFSSSNMALLFGSVPAGKDNALYKKQAAPGAKSLEEVLGSDVDEKNTQPNAEKKKVQANKKSQVLPAPGENLKQSGVSGGQGIMVKSKLPPAANTPPPTDEEKNQ